MTGIQQTSTSLPPYLDSSISLDDGRVFQLTEPLTDLRLCHDGTPRESRILFLCKHKMGDVVHEYVAKIKIQAANGGREQATAGPSTTTIAESKALQLFKDNGVLTAPQLIAFHQTVQPVSGPCPGGYITYTIMTKMPGMNLLDYKYWSRSYEERNELQVRFLAMLLQIHKLGIISTDRALRNVLWEPESKTMSIVDFEAWDRPTGLAMDDAKELQAWGLAQRPPPGTWIDEWRLQHH